MLTTKEKQTASIIRVKVLIKLASKYGRRCWYCQDSILFREAEVDHIVPRCRGGKNILSNYALACKPCNRAKSSMTLAEFLHWLKRPKKPVIIIEERAKVPEAQFSEFSEELEKGLRKASPR